MTTTMMIMTTTIEIKGIPPITTGVVGEQTGRAGRSGDARFVFQVKSNLCTPPS
ncbi:hypothetical protein [Paenibacillus brevis]|uniref:hypothetical protein n=1 Tax=Paenibacillus brevis TaxID=2841508 RepID=UPI001C0F7C51|nr:hypothetical protein [Paenibacillus brevis]